MIAQTLRPEPAPVIDLGPIRFEPDPSGALWWPAEETLVVADLHLEKGSFFAMTGQFLPPYDTRATLARLSEVVTRRRARRIISLGDALHDARAAGRLDPVDRATLAALTDRCDWLWVSGNHDAGGLASLGGSIIDELLVPPSIAFRHQALALATSHEVSGHFHPKARLSIQGQTLSARCFLSDGRRLILPAFGAYAGGLDSGDRVFRGLFPDGFDAWLLGRRRLLYVPGGMMGNRYRRTAV